MNQTLNLDVILAAANFAAQKHQGQVRKEKRASPYVTHPLSVARLILTIGGIHDQAILVAAILHDTLEDTDTQPEEISANFGKDVLNIVLEVSDDKTLKKNCRKQLQVIHTPDLSYPAKMIKLADKLANCRDILHSPPQDWKPDRCREYIQWSADVLARIRGTNQPLEAAFDALLKEAEITLGFQIEPYETVNNRYWGPEADDQCA
jgi:GTP diphosphokinase / guanosine-3',5'-bis(diphosphate) 3'-diphosphatase